MDLKLLLKRGALLAVANWPVVAMQFVAESAFQMLLAAPIVGAVILVGVLLGADVGDIASGGLRDLLTGVTGTLRAEPVALAAFIVAFAVVLAGGSVLMFVVKGGTMDVMLAAEAAAGSIEHDPITFDSLRRASRFSLPRFTSGCARLFRPYLALGIVLMLVYGASALLYLGFVVYGYRAAGDRALFIGWTLLAALASAALIAWITLVNLLYLLTQIALAVDGGTLEDASRTVARFIRAEFRPLAGVFLVVLALVVGATMASALAWSGVGLIAFVPVVGLAVVPLQLVALLVRGLLFEYIGLTALGAYLTLYSTHRAATARAAAVAAPSPIGHPA